MQTAPPGQGVVDPVVPQPPANQQPVADQIAPTAGPTTPLTNSTIPQYDQAVQSVDPQTQNALQPQDATVADQPVDLTEEDRLQLIESVLAEVSQTPSVLDQVAPAAMLASDPLNPPGVTGSTSKKPESAGGQSVQEVGGAAQVEYEHSAELPVEVEGFLERVEDHADKLPQEIVVTDTGIQAAPQKHPTQTVMVIPLTQEEAAEQPKDVKLSFTWLFEWSHKMIKKFVGKVVYKHEPNN